MSQISVNALVGGLYSIYSQKPTYKAGHDGSDGSCDGIGFIRGGLLRSGATKITNMKEPNQFARKCAVNLRKNDSFLSVGDVLLKAVDANDGSMPLPSKYRFGGSDFNGDLNNYTDISVVVGESPLLIMHMTNDGIIKLNNDKEWNYVCSLPYIVPKGEKVMSSAMVKTDNGASVKLYAKPSFSCSEVVDIPNETIVSCMEGKGAWTVVAYGDKKGYVLSKYIKQVEKANIMDIDIAELEKAYVILGKVLGHIK